MSISPQTPVLVNIDWIHKINAHAQKSNDKAVKAILNEWLKIHSTKTPLFAEDPDYALPIACYILYSYIRAMDNNSVLPEKKYAKLAEVLTWVDASTIPQTWIANHFVEFGHQEAIQLLGQNTQKTPMCSAEDYITLCLTKNRPYLLPFYSLYAPHFSDTRKGIVPLKGNARVIDEEMSEPAWWERMKRDHASTCTLETLEAFCKAWRQVISLQEICVAQKKFI